MWGYIFSRSVERNANLMEDSYYVYDLTILEFDKRNILFQNEKIYLCEIILNNKKKFEVISKRDLCYILVIYTNSDYNLTKNLYDICCPLVNTLDRYVPWLHKSKTVAIYREIIAAIQVNSNWTATHIAAKVGLDLFFMEKNNFKDMDRQFMPDMLTPFHLAIQNVNHNVVQALAQHGASLDLCDVHGFNAFHYASISSPEILMFILSLPGMFERASIRTNKGCTPLHLACYAHKLENIHILLRFGLSVSMLTVTPPHELEHIASSNNINVKKKKQSNDFVDVVVKFNDKEIDEFELDFMFYGGTPLHWTKKHNEVERFIALGFDVDAINAKGETALLLKTRRMRFKCMITLLVEQANVDIPDSFGNSALHYAAMLGDISITQSLVVFDGNVDHINRYQVSVRHLASTAKRENETEDNNYKMVLYVITAIGAKRCPITMKGCNDGCSYQGTFDGKRYVHWPIFSNAKFYRNVQIEEMVRLKLNNLANEPLKNRKKLVNMLSFDGGGVKGLITIQMLHELEKRLKHKFIDYFDWVTGTSTGHV
ncbi:hypothetical protein RDWZM_006280 [Blomia tropicalis]|uniref:phospholipase A2 n=1 Tax=Blomia tropicalis TaxID=40697 RepID=A0A9Q0M896_BLOTA|nr:hypothetical protein RDWZM_006280 [Blomia tropicalis]